VNPVPLMVRVNAAAPAVTLAGESEVMESGVDTVFSDTKPCR